MRDFLILLAAYDLLTAPSGFSWGSPLQQTWWYAALTLVVNCAAARVLFRPGRRAGYPERPAP